MNHRIFLFLLLWLLGPIAVRAQQIDSVRQVSPNSYDCSPPWDLPGSPSAARIGNTVLALWGTMIPNSGSELFVAHGQLIRNGKPTGYPFELGEMGYDDTYASFKVLAFAHRFMALWYNAADSLTRFQFVDTLGNRIDTPKVFTHGFLNDIACVPQDTTLLLIWSIQESYRNYGYLQAVDVEGNPLSPLRGPRASDAFRILIDKNLIPGKTFLIPAYRALPILASEKGFQQAGPMFDGKYFAPSHLYPDGRLAVFYDDTLYQFANFLDSVPVLRVPVQPTIEPDMVTQVMSDSAGEIRISWADTTAGPDTLPKYVILKRISLAHGANQFGPPIEVFRQRINPVVNAGRGEKIRLTLIQMFAISDCMNTSHYQIAFYYDHSYLTAFDSSTYIRPDTIRANFWLDNEGHVYKGLPSPQCWQNSANVPVSRHDTSGLVRLIVGLGPGAVAIQDTRAAFPSGISFDYPAVTEQKGKLITGYTTSKNVYDDSPTCSMADWPYPNTAVRIDTVPINPPPLYSSYHQGIAQTDLIAGPGEFATLSDLALYNDHYDLSFRSSHQIWGAFSAVLSLPRTSGWVRDTIIHMTFKSYSIPYQSYSVPKRVSAMYDPNDKSWLVAYKYQKINPDSSVLQLLVISRCDSMRHVEHFSTSRLAFADTLFSAPNGGVAAVVGDTVFVCTIAADTLLPQRSFILKGQQPQSMYVRMLGSSFLHIYMFSTTCYPIVRYDYAGKKLDSTYITVSTFPIELFVVQNRIDSGLALLRGWSSPPYLRLLDKHLSFLTADTNIAVGSSQRYLNISHLSGAMRNDTLYALWNYLGTIYGTAVPLKPYIEYPPKDTTHHDSSSVDSTFSMYPNIIGWDTHPTVRFTMNTSGNPVVRVYNDIGQLMMTEDLGERVAGVQLWHPDFDLPSGMYTLVLNANGGSSQTRFLVFR